MADHKSRLDTLNYGHLGIGTYSQESREWIFARQPDVSSKQQEHGTSLPNSSNDGFHHSFQKLAGPEFLHSTQQPTTRRKEHRGSQRALSNDLPHRYPQLSSVSQSTIRAAEEEEDLSTKFEKAPRNVNLLAFGEANVVSQSRIKKGRAVPVYAHAIGVTQHVLRLATFGVGTVSLDPQDTNDVAIIPVLLGDHETMYEDDVSPILKIAFTLQGANRVWMAIQKETRTTVFHPVLYQDQDAPLQISQVKKSQLDPNPIFHLPLSRTGGCLHADFAFHPENPLKLALVDQHGHWSVWSTFDHRKTTDKARFDVHLKTYGQLHSLDVSYQPASARPHYDGWHAIKWLKTSEGLFSLLVCDRRKIAIVTEQGETLDVPEIDFGPAREVHWILDLSVSRGLQDYFVLTSSRLIWLDLLPKEPKLTSGKRSSDLNLQWSHFRSSLDRGLRIEVFEILAGTFFIFLYSGDSNLLTVYKFGRDSASISRSLLDPVEFMVDRNETINAADSKSSEGFIDLHLRDIAYKPKTKDSRSERMVKLFVVTSDLSVQETTYSTKEKASIEPGMGAIGLPPHRKIPKSSAYIGDDDLDDFIVADGDDESAPTRSFKDLVQRRETAAAGERVRPAWAVNWETIHETASGNSQSETPVGPNAGALISISTFSDIVSRVGGVVRGSGKFAQQMLIHDYIRPDREVTIEDASQASEESKIWRSVLDEALGKSSITQSVLWRTLANKDQPDLGRSPTPSSFYNYIMSLHLLPLSHSMPSRLRITKENLIRHVTADLLLSSVSIRPSLPSEDLEKQQHDQTSQPASSSPVSSSQPIHRSIQRVQDPSNTLSTSPIHSAYDRLRTFVRFQAPPKLKSDQSPSALSQILSHLPSSTRPIANPSTYSYTQLSLAHEQAASGLSRATPAKIRDPRGMRTFTRPSQSSQRIQVTAPMIMSTGQPESLPPVLAPRQILHRGSGMRRHEAGVVAGGHTSGRADSAMSSQAKPFSLPPSSSQDSAKHFIPPPSGQQQQQSPSSMRQTQPQASPSQISLPHRSQQRYETLPVRNTTANDVATRGIATSSPIASSIRSTIFPDPARPSSSSRATAAAGSDLGPSSSQVQHQSQISQLQSQSQGKARTTKRRAGF